MRTDVICCTGFGPERPQWKRLLLSAFCTKTLEMESALEVLHCCIPFCSGTCHCSCRENPTRYRLLALTWQKVIYTPVYHGGSTVLHVVINIKWIRPWRKLSGILTQILYCNLSVHSVLAGEGGEYFHLIGEIWKLRDKTFHNLFFSHAVDTEI
jgi:hypothetical protein